MLAPQIPILTAPADIVNQALDMLGQPAKILGSIEDATPVSEAARRNYGQILRQLLRSSHWAFARKQANLQLLGDATGQSPAPVSPVVLAPWTYAYAWPTDAVAGRWLPASTPLDTQGVLTDANGVPLTTAPAPANQCIPLTPARFLVTSTDQYPTQVGVQPWTSLPDYTRTEGLGPTNRWIILTDIKGASFVYTRLVTVIEEWDNLFRNCMVTALALALAPTAIEDLKLRVEERNRLSDVLKMAIGDARVASGNDVGFPQSTDHMPDWITMRSLGPWGAYGGVAEFGCVGTYMPWQPFSLGGAGGVY